MPTHVPPSPTVDAAATSAQLQGRGEGRLLLRFEDVSQAGHLRLETLAAGLDFALMGGDLPTHPLTRYFSEHQIVPMRTRMMIERYPGTVAFGSEVVTEGTFVIAADGDHVFLNSEGHLRAPSKHRVASAVVGDGATFSLGRVFVEHTLTKPLAPKGERRVSSLPTHVHGLHLEYVHYTQTSTAALLGTAVLEVVGSVCPGLRHTDGNQHVNSVAYIVWFEEIAVRAARQHALSALHEAESIDIVYLRPSFAGEELTFEMALAAEASIHGKPAGLWARGVVRGPDAKVRAVAAMRLSAPPSLV